MGCSEYFSRPGQGADGEYCIYDYNGDVSIMLMMTMVMLYRKKGGMLMITMMMMVTTNNDDDEEDDDDNDDVFTGRGRDRRRGG